MKIFPPLVSVLFFLVLVASSSVAAQDRVGLEKEATSAGEETVERLVLLYADAVKSKEATKVMGVLDQMLEYDNPEFFDAAKGAMSYKLTSQDKKAVKRECADEGIRKPRTIQQRIAERECEVQVMAAGLLSNIGDPKSGALLHKTLKSKKIATEKPVLCGAVIAALGKMGYRKAEKDVEPHFRSNANKETMKAAVRYFGQIKTTNFDIVRALCVYLDPPEPSNVDDPNNPPSGYWMAQWEVWSHAARDVTWALKEITGQEFRAGYGDNPSDSAKALKYVKDNKKRLGLK